MEAIIERIKLNILGAQTALEGFAGDTGLCIHFCCSGHVFLFGCGNSPRVWENAKLLELPTEKITTVLIPSDSHEQIEGLHSLPIEESMRIIAHPYVVINGIIGSECTGKAALITRESPTFLADDVWLVGDLPEEKGHRGEQWCAIVVKGNILILVGAVPFGLLPLVKTVGYLFPDMGIVLVGDIHNDQDKPDEEFFQSLKDAGLKGLYPTKKTDFSQKACQEIGGEFLRAGESLDFSKPPQA